MAKRLQEQAQYNTKGSNKTIIRQDVPSQQDVGVKTTLFLPITHSIPRYYSTGNLLKNIVSQWVLNKIKWKFV